MRYRKCSLGIPRQWKQKSATGVFRQLFAQHLPAPALAAVVGELSSSFQRCPQMEPRHGLPRLAPKRAPRSHELAACFSSGTTAGKRVAAPFSCANGLLLAQSTTWARLPKSAERFEPRKMKSTGQKTKTGERRKDVRARSRPRTYIGTTCRNCSSSQFLLATSSSFAEVFLFFSLLTFFLHALCILRPRSSLLPRRLS